MPPSLAEFQPLKPAEERLLAGLASGNLDRLGDGAVPAPGDGRREIRAALLRYLILGGNDTPSPHERGVRLSGAWITGALDLEGCRVPRDISLKDCRFEAAPILRSAIIDNLFLDGSHLPGCIADRLEARGGVYLRGAHVAGELRLPGARLGGSLECDGTTISRPDGLALNADGANLRGVSLRGASVSGGVFLVGARLDADFDCVGATIVRGEGVVLNGDGLEARGDLALRLATIRGEVRLVGIRLGGDMDCTGAILEKPGGDAVQLGRAVIEGAFFLRRGAVVRGTLNLTGASIGSIDDEEASWPQAGDLLLNRCLYGAFIGGPVDARARIEWLARQDPARWGEDFWPQPYEQLTKVLGEMGHGGDARAVLIEKERLQRRARRARATNRLWRAILWLSDATLAVTVRYGRQPLLAFVWLVALWLIGAAIFAGVEERGAFRPNLPVTLRSPEWVLCGVDASATIFMPSLQRSMNGLAAPGQTQLDCYRQQPEAAAYPRFNALMYSLDALLPVVDTGQSGLWSPDSRTPLGRITRSYLYIQTVAGWALSLLAVAGFSGLVKSN